MNMRATHFAISAAACLLAAPCAVPADAPEARPNANMQARTGGMLLSPAKGAHIAIVSTLREDPAGGLAALAAEMSKVTHLPVLVQDRAGAKTADLNAFAAEVMKRGEVGAVIICHEAKGQAALLVAPEDRWVAVNAAALRTAGVSGEVFSGRVRKELWRALGYLMGAANSNFENCLLRPVFSPDGLDALKASTLCPEPFNKFLAQAGALGIQPVRTVTYRKACEEGWAPAPTNDFQRAIWEEVKGKK